MSFFAKIEQFCAGFIEHAFAKSFPSDVEPAQIARKLVSTMEARTREDEGRLHAPSSYGVYVSPADFERLEEHRDYLERAWSNLLCDLASKVGVDFDDGDVRVALAARSSVPLGAIEIDAGTLHNHRTFCLRTIEGVPPDGVYDLTTSARIGRGEESEIVLRDPSVSRTHAVVDVATGEAVVRDLGSTNGTFLNGRRVESASLQDGDELRLGNTRMRFETQ